MKPTGRFVSSGFVARTVAYACSRHGLTREDAGKLAAAVHRNLAENGYAVVEEPKGGTTFASFVSVVVQRLALDYRGGTCRVSKPDAPGSSPDLTAAIAKMPDDARLILQLRFEQALDVRQIARMLRLARNVLDLRLKQYARQLREELERAGLDSRQIVELVGLDAFDRTRTFRPLNPPALLEERATGA